MAFICSCAGEGVIEMDHKDVSAEGKSGTAEVQVIRKQGSKFPAAVEWSAKDGDAKFGENYNQNQG